MWEKAEMLREPHIEFQPPLSVVPSSFLATNVEMAPVSQSFRIASYRPE